MYNPVYNGACNIYVHNKYKKIITEFKHDNLRREHLKLIEKTNDPVEKGRLLIILEDYDNYKGYDTLSESEKAEI